MAARGKKELLILGDRNFDGTEEKLIRTYADGLFHNVKNYTIYRPEDLEEMYGPREGNMRHISHVLVACVTPLMRNPAVMNRGNHSDNVRQSLLSFFRRLTCWHQRNPHLRMTLIPPIKRKDYYSYTADLRVYEEVVGKWLRQNTYCQEVSKIPTLKVMYESDGKTLRPEFRNYYAIKLMMTLHHTGR